MTTEHIIENSEYRRKVARYKLLRRVMLVSGFFMIYSMLAGKQEGPAYFISVFATFILGTVLEIMRRRLGLPWIFALSKQLRQKWREIRAHSEE